MGWTLLVKTITGGHSVCGGRLGSLRCCRNAEKVCTSIKFEHRTRRRGLKIKGHSGDALNSMAEGL